MDKKLFGIKLSTYISTIICFAVAFFVWFVAKYIDISESNEQVFAFLSELKYL